MPKITTLYAYVMADTNDDDEGIPSFKIHTLEGMMHMPLVGADMDRARCLRGKAQQAANAHGKPVKLVRATGLELVEVIEPQKEGTP